MDRDRWSRVERLFGDAVEVESGERGEYVAAACEGDLELRQEVDSLLAAHLKANDDFLEELDDDRVARFVDVMSPPERIGPWRILEEIGRGGMGVVYEACRDDGQFHQLAALKLIQGGLDSARTVQRFLLERQILARMEHPAIARLLDGGVTPEGRPWFALELIDGVPLTEYCEEQDLGVEQRLRLFKNICSAVEYAHRSLVIHRDLKPSNVLVDHDGQVKLLDFGIAKLLSADEEAEAAKTEADKRVVTPGYGAPEQWLGGPVTTTTDVYSLGIILYELLAGQLPYGSGPSDIAQQFRAWADSQPPRLSSLADENREDSAARRLPSFGRRLGVELDAIAAKAINSEPEHRYASVEALREDLERYLRGEPVRACPNSLRYRAEKFLRRHRTSLVVVALVGVSLLTGLSLALWQAGVAARERDIARQESEETEEVKNFIVDLFRASDPSDEQRVDLTAKQLLARGVERVRAGLEDRPDLRSELLTAVGEVANLLGDHEGARELFEEALAIESGPAVRDQLRRAAALNGLGETSVSLGDNVSAEAAHRQALAIRLELADPDSLDIAQTFNNLGNALAGQRELSEAIESYRHALSIQRRVAGENAIEALETLGNLGIAYRLQGDLLAAEKLLGQAIEQMAKRPENQKPSMVALLSELATVKSRFGRPMAAERLLRQSLELSRNFWGESHPDTRISMNNLAMALHTLGKDPEAEVLMRKTLEYDLEQYGPQHTYVATSRDNLGRVLLELGRVEEAITQFEIAEQVHQVSSSERTLAAHRIHLGWARLATGHPRQARQMIDQALGTERQRTPGSQEKLAAAVTAAAFVRGALELGTEAEALFQEALEIQESRTTPRHPAAGLALYGLGELRLRQGRLKEAESYLKRASEIWAETLPEAHWRQAVLRVALGECEIRMGRIERGREILDLGLAQLTRDRGEEHWRTRAAVSRRDSLVTSAQM